MRRAALWAAAVLGCSSPGASAAPASRRPARPVRFAASAARPVGPAAGPLRRVSAARAFALGPIPELRARPLPEPIFRAAPAEARPGRPKAGPLGAARSFAALSGPHQASAGSLSESWRAAGARFDGLAARSRMLTGPRAAASVGQASPPSRAAVLSAAGPRRRALPRFGPAYDWPAPARAGALAALLAAAAFLSAVSGGLPEAAGILGPAPFGLGPELWGAVERLLGAFAGALGPGRLPLWQLALAAAALAALLDPLKRFALRLSSWSMSRRPAGASRIFALPPGRALARLAWLAAKEEALYRGLFLIAAASALGVFLPGWAAAASAAILTSAAFAWRHGYGSVWARVVSGLAYAAAFFLSGSLLLPMAAHFLSNARLYFRQRRAAP